MKSLHTHSPALVAAALLLGGVASAQGSDDCATPTAISGTGTWIYDTSTATTSGFDGGSGGVGCYNNINQDLFWVWTANVAGDYVIDTENSSYDTKINVHAGTDCNASCIDGDDDSGTGLMSKLILPGVNAGDTFLVQVGGYGSGFGGGNLNIDFDPCSVAGADPFEPNDSCAAAVPIGDGLYTGLTVSKANPDFYSVTVADGATLDASIFFAQSNADTDLYLWEVGVCNDDLANLGTGALAAGTSVTDNEIISWTNTTGADVDCVIRVNVWPSSAGDCSDYDLQLSGAGPGGPTLFCDPANANSSGNSVDLSGSDFSGPGVFHLEATGGPSAQFGYFLVSATTLTPGVPVSQGLICVAAPQGRYNGIGGLSSIGQFDGSGVLQNIAGSSSVGTGFDVPSSLPNPPGGVITPGSTFHFQLWYRDGPNSNFSNGITVVFP